MKHIAKILIALITTTILSSAPAAATTFTYQGELESGGSPYTGTAGMVFELYDAAADGTQQGPTLNRNVAVVDGLFQVALDFGVQPFENDLWLAITVNGTVLSPRQSITSVPQAINSRNLGGSPAAAYRSWPMQVTRADRGATIDGVGGPTLDAFGTSGDYPTLSWYYTIPSLYQPGEPAEARVALHSFSGGCSARVRVWGLGAFGSGQEQTVVFPSGGGTVAISRLISNLGTNSSAYMYVARHADHAEDTCTGNINVRGIHVNF